MLDDALFESPGGQISGTLDEEGLDVPELRAGEFLYVRVVQANGGAAWSSPWFIE